MSGADLIVTPRVSPVKRCEHKSVVLERQEDPMGLFFIFTIRCPECGQRATRKVSDKQLKNLTRRELTLFQERLARLLGGEGPTP